MGDLFASDDDFGDDAFGLADGQASDDLSDIPADLFRSPAAKSQAASSPAADCTDAASEHGSSSSSASPSPSQVSEAPALSREAKVAMRVAKKNRARLHRYHRSKAELVELRDEVNRLARKLERLRLLSRLEQERGVETLLAASPSPLASDESEEIDPRECALPKTRQALVSGTSGSSWRDMAATELRQRRRAEAVQRKLRRITNEFAQRCALFEQAWSGAQAKPTGETLPLFQTPRVPGTDSLGAFTHNGAVVLRELYRMACSANKLQPVLSTSSPPGFSGGSLAYSLFLGPGVEFEWNEDYDMPVADPRELVAHYFRALSTQPPDPHVLKATHKTHAMMEHTMFERAITFRAQVGSSFIDLQGVKVTQVFEGTDHVAIMSAMAVNVSGTDTTPLFRASSWKVLTKSQGTHGSPCCLVRSSSHIYCATSDMCMPVDSATRSAFLKSWRTKMEAKRLAVQHRLRLVLA